ncbi:MAG: mechanosensitive ion channel [Deltaproteobacteria bacterium]|nr:mechanosensitive ion channel [Deltaproteobacteria bacterium]
MGPVEKFVSDLFSGATLPGVIVSVALIPLLVLARLKTQNDRIAKKLARAILAFALFLILAIVDSLLPHAGDHHGKVDGKLTPFEAAMMFVLAYAALKAFSSLFLDFFLSHRKKIEIPSIFRDIGMSVVFIVLVFVILGNAGVDVTQLFTTSAILTAVIGLALQDVLSNVIAGLAIQMEKPFEIGDWVTFQGRLGRVEQVSWRATRLITRDNERVVVPNNQINRDVLQNHTKPGPSMKRKIYVGVDYGVPPNRVRDVILAAVADLENVVKDPPPKVIADKFGDSSIEYLIEVWIDEFRRYHDVENAVRTAVWYNFKRARIEIPWPIRNVYMHEVKSEEEIFAGRVQARIKALNSIDFVKVLPDEEIHALANSARRLVFARGEAIIREGDEGESFFLMSEGKVEVRVGGAVVATLGPGNFFGEMSVMTGERRTATVVAATDCEMIMIGKEPFAELFQKQPDIAGRISDVIAKRQLELAGKRAELGAAGDDALRSHSSSLLNKIKKFFNF